MTKTAIVTGAAGQDGSYLCELLLEKGFHVYAIHRRCSTNTLWRLSNIISNPKLILTEGDITDSNFITNLISNLKPDIIYNTAAQSHVGASFSQPSYTFEVNTQGVLHILEAIRNHSPETRMLQCSTSEMFGNNFSYFTSFSSDLQGGNGTTMYRSVNSKKCQSLDTPFDPRSPYAVSKVAAHNLVGLYRKAYGLHASCAISMNHESPRRSEEFVTRKITNWIGKFLAWRSQEFYTINPLFIPYDHLYDQDDYICYGKAASTPPSFFPKLRLGNIESYRDWGHARDYCEAFIKITLNDLAEDWMIATGETHSVKDFLTLAFEHAGLGNYKNYIVIDKTLFRPAEVDYLCGDPSKTKEQLGWVAKTNFKQLVEEMVNEDINRHLRKNEVG